VFNVEDHYIQFFKVRDGELSDEKIKVKMMGKRIRTLFTMNGV
jgi:hypothetical protein